MYLLDTNILIEHLAGRFDITGKVKEIGPNSCFVSSIVAYELLVGVYKSQRADNRTRIELLLAGFSHIPVDLKCAEATAKLRWSLEKAGTKIGPYDL